MAERYDVVILGMGPGGEVILVGAWAVAPQVGE